MKNEIVKLLEDRDFVQKLMTREDVEDVKKLFKDKGVEVSDSDINELGEVMNEIVETLGKMSEEELRAICGGREQNQPGTPLIEHHDVPGAAWIRSLVGYKPEKLGDVKITGVFSKEFSRKVVESFQSTGSAVKDFIGVYANEIAASTITLTAATALLGGAYGIKKGIRWYRRNYSR